MDLQLIRSFVEVAASGSFAAASERLFVTQSAVSLRIQRLEDQLGRPLFTRSKDGVALTPAGREFRSFALTILRNWEQARQRVSALETRTEQLTIGAQPSLWPRFGFRWLDLLHAARPCLMLRAEMGPPDTLANLLLSGAVQVILTYSAVTRAGLRAEPLMEEQLVMVAPWPDTSVADLQGRYVLADWGADFSRFHEEALPALHDARITMALGAATQLYVGSRPYAAYLPARHARRDMAEGRLHLVADAPPYALPAWAIWREDIEESLADVARRTLAEVAQRAGEATSEVLDQF